jgi:hypothetical protein
VGKDTSGRAAVQVSDIGDRSLTRLQRAKSEEGVWAGEGTIGLGFQDFSECCVENPLLEDQSRFLSRPDKKGWELRPECSFNFLLCERVMTNLTYPG